MSRSSLKNSPVPVQVKDGRGGDNFGFSTVPRNFGASFPVNGVAQQYPYPYPYQNPYQVPVPTTPKTPQSDRNLAGNGTYFTYNPANFVYKKPSFQQAHAAHANPYSTFGRRDLPKFSSFRTGNGGPGQAQVVDGFVVNRFSKPTPTQSQSSPVPSPSPKGNRGTVLNSEFYRNPEGQSQEPEEEVLREREESFEDSFEADVDIPPDYDFEEIEDNMANSNHHLPSVPENPPPTRGKAPPENRPSLLLSREENQTVFDILGKGRQTLATAVVKLLVPTPNQSKWQVKEVGVACFVRDTTKKSYFIQVLSLVTKSMAFRQEIYNQFEYEMMSEHLLTFEGDNSMVGILFADRTEVANFRDSLDGKLEAKRQRRNEREQNRRSKLIAENQGQNNISLPYNAPQKYVPQQRPPAMTNGASTTSTTYIFPTSTPKTKMKKSKDAKKKPSIRKEDISQPMDFKHIQHVGFDPSKGFSVDGEADEDLKKFFEMAGISSDTLKDESTRTFIYNFIENIGGVEKIKSVKPAAPPPPISNPIIAPPPVPNRFVPGQKTPAPPPPPSRPVPPVPGYNQNVPPPPPPMRTTSSNVPERSPAHQFHSPNVSQGGQSQNNGPARPPPPNFSNSPSNKPAVPQPQGNANGPIPPPPPPPPPMPEFGAPPPPPPPPMMKEGPTENGTARPSPKPSLPPVSDDRSNLMAQIQKGVQLKKVDASDTPPKKTGGLADCLSDIQRGVNLKAVQHQPKEPPSLDTMDGLAGALARALADRSRAINPDSSSSDEDEEADEDEWD